MKAVGRPHWYISGPHAGDYYLLRDEQSECIFDRRLAERVREASDLYDEGAGAASAGLLEIWVDDADQQVWYVFEARRSDEP